MKFLEKIAKLFGLKEKTKTDEIMEERAKLKKAISKNLQNHGFNGSEIKEVLEILKKCEEEIQVIKDSMIGTNINNERAVEDTESALKQIRELELQAGIDMKEKIAQIKTRKENKYN